MRRGRRTALAFGVVAVIAVAASCREPTQITVRITTGEKCADLAGVEIIVGPSAAETDRRFQQRFAAAVTQSCDASGLIGTLVVTPGASSGTIVVAAGVRVGSNPAPEPASCGDPANAASCIIARRSFSFIDHTSLVLPIDLDPLCVGKACDPASTCFKGSCVSDGVLCSGASCGLAGENPGGSGTDASSSDGAYDADLGDVVVGDADVGDGSLLGTDSGTHVADAGHDGSSVPDAGMPTCGLTGGAPGMSSYCYGGGSQGGAGSSSTGVTTTGTCANSNIATTNCCRCVCADGGVPASCDVAPLSSGSCHPTTCQ